MSRLSNLHNKIEKLTVFTSATFLNPLKLEIFYKSVFTEAYGSIQKQDLSEVYESHWQETSPTS